MFSFFSFEVKLRGSCIAEFHNSICVFKSNPLILISSLKELIRTLQVLSKAKDGKQKGGSKAI